MASEESEKKVSEQEQSKSELFSSAKLVAEAAQSTLRNESDKVDKAKVADAAGDLLDAAGQYGNLDDQKGIGQYVDKAADYLHQYKATPTTTTAPSDQSKPDSKPDQAKVGGDFAKFAGGLFK